MWEIALVAPLTIHIVRESSGAGGAGTEQVAAAMIDLNRLFEGSGIRFCLQRPMQYVDDSGLYDGAWSTAALAARMAQSNVAGTINVYVIQDMVHNGAPLNCGTTVFDGPGIAVKLDCFGTPSNPSTLAHEMGHFLSLSHTHCGAPRSWGQPCPYGPGDGIDDTPPDPGLRRGIAPHIEYDVTEAPSCTYVGPAPWDPDTRNVMSYSRPDCRSSFTQGQRDRMLEALLALPEDLRRGCGPPAEVGGLTALMELLNEPGAGVADLLALLAEWS
jgi:hypothetical protein